jgi:hypothetical protein
MTDVYFDNDGKDLIVDLRPQKVDDKTFRPEYPEGVDLASGYPDDQVWTTRDGRRFAVPNMSDKHLLNTIAFLRRREEEYKRTVIAQYAGRIVNMTVVGMMFENAPFHGDAEFDEACDRLREQGHEAAKKLFAMQTEEWLRENIPQYPYMLQEAYRRKILVEVDNSKIADEHGWIR